MEAKLIKASGRCYCRGATCPKDPKYTKPDRYGRSYILKGTTCAAVTIDSAKGYATAYYCRDCIQIIHDQVRMILNPALWVFM